MFDSTLNPLWQRYILAVQEEVKPALGCTEPISLALAAAVAAAELEGPVERVEAWVSPNLMKNGLGVTVPGTGMVGLPIAAALGALGGNANAGLEVLKDATAQAISDAKALLAAGKVSVKIQEPCDEILFSRAKVWNGEKWACVTIVGGHTNIVHIELTAITDCQSPAAYRLASAITISTCRRASFAFCIISSDTASPRRCSSHNSRGSASEAPSNVNRGNNL